MLKRIAIGLIACSSTATLAHESNPFLNATISTIESDSHIAEYVVRAADPTDLLDTEILNGIIRSRSARFQLEYIFQNRNGEMLPSGIDELPAPEAAARMTRFGDLLTQQSSLLTALEREFSVQLSRPDHLRDFSDARRIFSDFLASIDSLKQEFIAIH